MRKALRSGYRARFARRMAKPYQRLRGSWRELVSNGLVAGLVTYAVKPDELALTVLTFVVSFAVIYFVIPWAEYSFYWWSAPSSQQRSTDRRLTQLTTAVRRLAATRSQSITVAVPVPPPNLTIIHFDGATAGVHVLNEGGDCHVRATIQVLSVEGRDVTLRNRDKRIASWDKVPRENYGALLRTGAEGRIEFARYHHHESQHLEISGWDGAIEVWSFNKRYPAGAPSAADVLLEIVTTPASERISLRYHLELDHTDAVINMGQILQ